MRKTKWRKQKRKDPKYSVQLARGRAVEREGRKARRALSLEAKQGKCSGQGLRDGERPGKAGPFPGSQAKPRVSDLPLQGHDYKGSVTSHGKSHQHNPQQHNVFKM